MSDTEKKYTADDLKDLTQRHVDHVCHYRNLAIVLGAKPNQMLTDYDKKLCEKGIDPDDNGGGYHWSVRDCIEEVEDLWQKNEELRAEAERLRALKPVGTYSMDWNHEQERLRLTAERDEARAELASWRGNFDGPLAFVRDHTDKAFKRGAEAMREAAAEMIEREIDSLMLRAGLAAGIRALPLPEDKP